jgi:hypothetical protein
MRRRLVGFCWKARDKPRLRSFNTEFFNTNDASPRRNRSLRPPAPGIHALVPHEGLDQGLILQEAMALLSLHVTRYDFVP